MRLPTTHLRFKKQKLHIVVLGQISDIHNTYQISSHMPFRKAYFWTHSLHLPAQSKASAGSPHALEAQHKVAQAWESNCLGDYERDCWMLQKDGLWTQQRSHQVACLLDFTKPFQAMTLRRDGSCKAFLAQDSMAQANLLSLGGKDERQQLNNK